MRHAVSRTVYVRFCSLLLLIGLLASGVTYAALQSPEAVLTGSTIQTASANLLISTDGTAYSSSQSGFAFSNLIPGGPAVPAAGNLFYLKNAGGATLALKLAVSSTPTNPDNVDFAKVKVILTALPTGQSQTFTLQNLIAAKTSGGLALTSPTILPASGVQQFMIQVSMDADALSAASASISGIDLSFTGVATS